MGMTLIVFQKASVVPHSKLPGIKVVVEAIKNLQLSLNVILRLLMLFTNLHVKMENQIVMH
jgi:hypothetical protein